MTTDEVHEDDGGFETATAEQLAVLLPLVDDLSEAHLDSLLRWTRDGVIFMFGNKAAVAAVADMTREARREKR